MGPLVLEGQHINFSYDRPVLADISLCLYGGEILGIVGPNGAGKTTLLRILYGSLTPFSGEIRIYGNESLQQLGRRAIARRLAVVRQETTIGLPISVANFVMQGRYPHLSGFGFERASDVKIVAEALQQAASHGLAGHEIHEISGGERQRVLLARALAQEPQILLLDEPTANLDMKYQIEIMALVRGLTCKRDMGTIVVTHDLNLISEFADRLLLLKDGRMVCCGAPADVMTSDRIREVFEVEVQVDINPATGRPRVSYV
ncbi:MAG: ABC transporter ATP-binding protein [Acidobacteria bacterium]|nr:ABC transporter ATP-binding protein [Acidobacteriota bacterium]MBI3655721.1 ABC transporter ATP-binding protein [Acidobacteriota bacterium]